MNQVVREKVVNVFLDYEDYKNKDKDHLYYIFIEEIYKILGKIELLKYHEFIINYKEKFCIFSDFEIDYETEEKIYTNYKIILKPKRLKPLFNIFIFNH